MKQRTRFLQASLVLVTLSYLHTSTMGAALIDSSDNTKTLWPRYYGENSLPSYLGDENFIPENDDKFIPENYFSKKIPKAIGILDLLQYGPLNSRERNDYLSVVNKRTHDEETSFGTFSDDFGELMRQRKSKGASGFDALLEAARILDSLEDSRSFSPWAG